jgi:hypothetical protein
LRLEIKFAIMIRVKRFHGCSTSPKYGDLVDGTFSRDGYARWSMELREIRPNGHPISKIGMLYASPNYRVIFMRGHKDEEGPDGNSSTAHDGMFAYESLWQGALYVLARHHKDCLEDI